MIFCRPGLGFYCDWRFDWNFSLGHDRFALLEPAVSGTEARCMTLNEPWARPSGAVSANSLVVVTAPFSQRSECGSVFESDLVTAIVLALC